MQVLVCHDSLQQHAVMQPLQLSQRLMQQIRTCPKKWLGRWMVASSSHSSQTSNKTHDRAPQHPLARTAADELCHALSVIHAPRCSV